MPILDRQGKPLNENDVKMIVKMLKGAYENHLKRIEVYNEISNSVVAQIFYDTYKSRIEKLEKDYMDKLASPENFSADEILDLEFINTNNAAREKCKKDIVNFDLTNLINNYYNDGGFYIDYIIQKGDDTGFENDRPEDYDPIKDKDTLEAYNHTESAFKLADEAVPEVENIISYNPNSDLIRSLHGPRSGNSSTLASKNDDVRNKGIFSFDSGAELSRIKASELMSKMAKGQDIGFGDLFEVFTSLNEFARLGNAEGGKLRASNVGAGNIKGIAAFKAPSRLYKTLDKAAACINQIRDTQDPNLKKTRALQVASFVYSMTLSEHVFGDGNGRSCRLLADTILQSLGLPPHVPNETTKSKAAVATIGDTLDFDVSAQGFIEGVLNSSEILKQVQAAEAQEKKEREDTEALERENEIQKNHTDYQNSVNVWDEVMNDVTLPLGLVSLAKTFKESALDVSNPLMLRLLTRYNKDSGKVETLVLNGHKNEEGYPSPTGFTNTKQGAMDFLYELDNVLGDDDLYDYNKISDAPDNGRSFMVWNKRDTSEYGYGTFGGVAYNTNKSYNVKAPDPVNNPTRFMNFIHSIFGGYKEEFKAYDTYLAQKAKYDQDLEAFNKKNKALESFAENNAFSIQKSQQISKDYTSVNLKIQENKTIEEKLKDKALEELDAQKTIDVIMGRKKLVLGTSPNHRKIISTELEKVDELPMEGLALIASNSVEINKDINDGSTQKPQEFIFKAGKEYTKEDDDFRKMMEIYQARSNVAGKIQDSLFSGKDVRMGSRFSAVIEGRQKLNIAAKAYQSGNKQPLIDLLKDCVPPILDNLKWQASTVLRSSGQAFVEMVDALKQILDNDPFVKEQLNFPEEELNMLYGSSALIKEFVYPKKRQYETFVKYMAEGSEDKVSYVKEMLYSSYLANTLESQIISMQEKVNRDYTQATSDAIDKYLQILDVPQKHKHLYGEQSISFVIGNKIMEDHLTYPDIYSKFQTEAGIKQVKDTFENEIVNTPEFNALLTKNRKELAEMDFAQELKTILEKNKERQMANNQPEVNHEPNPQQNVIEVNPVHEINVQDIPQDMLNNDAILNKIVNGPTDNMLEKGQNQPDESQKKVSLDDGLNVPDFGKKTEKTEQEQNKEKTAEKGMEPTFH